MVVVQLLLPVVVAVVVVDPMTEVAIVDLLVNYLDQRRDQYLQAAVMMVQSAVQMAAAAAVAAVVKVMAVMLVVVDRIIVLVAVAASVDLVLIKVLNLHF